VNAGVRAECVIEGLERLETVSECWGWIFECVIECL
jgi:hypothetical protein